MPSQPSLSLSSHSLHGELTRSTRSSVLAFKSPCRLLTHAADFTQRPGLAGCVALATRRSQDYVVEFFHSVHPLKTNPKPNRTEPSTAREREREREHSIRRRSKIRQLSADTTQLVGAHPVRSALPPIATSIGWAPPSFVLRGQ